jgi:peptidoglycan/LPS O-acetylase OafA/YrhL
VRATATLSSPELETVSGGGARWRHDLDGLRVLAVLLVAVYHIWLHRVSGGVDVFLVLSGFFVGGAVVRACTDNRFFAGAYFRRMASRLLPPLVVVVSAVLVATVILMPVTVWSETARQSIASILHVENWYLAMAGREYGAADVTASPYQHIWSMAVQGQLFVALPLLLLAVASLLRRMHRAVTVSSLTTFVGALALASFVYACVGVLVDQPWAYYDSFARAWEYLAGTLAAVALRHFGDNRGTSGAGRAAVVAAAGWVGLAAILATGFLADGRSQFPGPVTLLPVGGALLLIAFYGPRWAPSRMLSWGPLARAGRFAYAFYLWHWPILVFVIAMRERDDVGWLAGFGVLLMSATLAVLTTRLIAWVKDAQPLRSADARRRVVVGTTVIVLVVALPAAWLVRVEYERGALSSGRADLSTHPGAMAIAYPDVFGYDEDAGIIPAFEVAAEDKPATVDDDCASERTEVRVCTYGDVMAERVLVVAGGSHSEQWIDAVSLLGEQHGFRVDALIKYGCELVDGLGDVEFFAESNPYCERWSANALRRILSDAPDAVLTTWTRPTEEPRERLEMIPRAYEDAWTVLARAGIPTIAIRDNPWTATDTVQCVANSESDPSACGVLAAEVLDDQPPVPQLPGESEASVRLLDLNDVICPDSWCPFVQGGRLVYRDDHHLTNSYVLSTTPILEERLLPLLGW